jgi:hypothetical protein
MKISIEIKLPNERAIFVALMFLQVVGCAIGVSLCSFVRCYLNAALLILASLTAGVGCFWQHEDLAFFSLDHAHRAVTALVLMLLLIASCDEFSWPVVTILVLDGLYILSSIALACTHKMRNEADEEEQR